MKSLSHHALLPLLLLVNAPAWAAQESVTPAGAISSTAAATR